MHGDLSKHLGMDSSTDHFDIVLTTISTTSGTGNTRKYQQIDVYIYQCEH